VDEDVACLLSFLDFIKGHPSCTGWQQFSRVLLSRTTWCFLAHAQTEHLEAHTDTLRSLRHVRESTLVGNSRWGRLRLLRLLSNRFTIFRQIPL